MERIMKTALSFMVIISLACHSALSCSVCQGYALKCHTCVASNEDECNKQGSASCPQFADACSTISGPNTMMKSCTYKAFCDKAHGSSTGTKMECCFGENCNGPHKGHSHGAHRNSAGATVFSPALLIATALLRTAFTSL
ncbi:uncharacterized protein [Eucyclogobius newberryi]|uniref:uncharacterized protein isoform X1 n=1 Tax=Eucyclogobius newberryi TaxID=166745 RepID=UPI003B5B6769